MAFTMVSEAKLLAYASSGVPPSMSLRGGVDAGVAFDGSVGRAMPRPRIQPSSNSRPNLTRRLTGGLQAFMSDLQHKAANHAPQQQTTAHNGMPYYNHMPRAAPQLAQHGGNGTLSGSQAQFGQFTRADGFLKIGANLPLLNQSVQHTVAVYRDWHIPCERRSQNILVICPLRW
jgi:hypothetical protein